MSMITAVARAKINLSLDVVRKRPDGYHDLMGVMQTIELSDGISIELTGKPVFEISSNRAFLPKDTRNLALSAAKLFLERTGRTNEGTSIILEKNIPVCAGLGGGSADAAAVLRALSGIYPVDEADMMNWALELGSDVPFCLLGGTALAEGRGEIMTPLPPMPPCAVVLSRPDIFVSTREAFGAINVSRIKQRPDHSAMIKALKDQEWEGVARLMFNVFEEPLSVKHKIIAQIRRRFIDLGALGAVMSGTGPTVFALFKEQEKARSAYESLVKEIPETFLTHTT